MLGATLAVSVLALVAGIGTARAASVPWNAAVLKWPVPPGYEGVGPETQCENGPCEIAYIVEALAPGAADWVPLAIVPGTTYTATDLYPGEWRFRVRAKYGADVISPPSPEGVKVIKAPTLPTPKAPTISQ